MTALIIAIVGTLNIVCFFLGVMLGQKLNRGERIEAPNPIKAIEERKEKKEAKKVQDRMDVIMENIETYNGTGIGQKDVPKG